VNATLLYDTEGRAQTPRSRSSRRYRSAIRAKKSAGSERQVVDSAAWLSGLPELGIGEQDWKAFSYSVSQRLARAARSIDGFSNHLRALLW